MNDVNKEYSLIDDDYNPNKNNNLLQVIDITANQVNEGLKSLPKESAKFKKNQELFDVLKRTVQEIDALNRKVSILEGKERKETKVMLELAAKGGGLVPPQAVELEEAVLGAMMYTKNSVMKVVDIISIDCFYKQQTQEVYKAIDELFWEEKPIDMLTVIQKLRSMGKIDIVGGAAYIGELTSKVASDANIEYHARILQQKALARKMISLFRDKTALLFDERTDPLELLDNVTEEILNIRAEFLNEEWEWQK